MNDKPNFIQIRIVHGQNVLLSSDHDKEKPLTVMIPDMSIQTIASTLDEIFHKNGLPIKTKILL